MWHPSQREYKVCVVPTSALYDALCPLYLTFYQKKNKDKLVQLFIGLIPQSSKLQNCEDYEAAKD